jgi:hypothetical protein
MTRLNDIMALRVGDEVEIHGNGFFNSIGFDKVSGIIRKISLNSSMFTIECYEIKSQQKIDYGDGYIFLLNHCSSTDL